MKTAELDDFLAFNDQLAALVEAGVPIGVGQEIPDRDLTTMLARINAWVARRVSRGDSVEVALDDDEAVPEWYRTLVITALQSDNIDATLNEFSHVANSAEESKSITQSALIYPLVVCGMAFLGMVGLCLFFVPTLESVYESFGLRPGTGLVVLQKLRVTLPFWVAALPILVLLFFAWRYRRRSQPAVSTSGGSKVLGALSGTRRAMYQQRCAYFAESMISLEERDVPLNKAMEVAAKACGEPSLADGAPSVATSTANDSMKREGGGSSRIPPFMRWALFRSEPVIERKQALQMAASLYRESSRHSMRRARITAPIVALVVLGGGVTLLYGLALFVPVSQMLKSVASMH